MPRAGRKGHHPGKTGGGDEEAGDRGQALHPQDQLNLNYLYAKFIQDANEEKKRKLVVENKARNSTPNSSLNLTECSTKDDQCAGAKGTGLKNQFLTAAASGDELKQL